jgi:hypothetical protein
MVFSLLPRSILFDSAKNLLEGIPAGSYEGMTGDQQD